MLAVRDSGNYHMIGVEREGALHQMSGDDGNSAYKIQASSREEKKGPVHRKRYLR